MQLAVNIVVLASIYALIACGYVLIYRVSRVLNLAHGELMMLGAYMVLATASLFDGHPVMALAAAILLSLLVGALVYVFLMRRMTGEMVLAAILTTVALGILIRGFVVLVWSAQQQYPAQVLAVSNPSDKSSRLATRRSTKGGTNRESIGQVHRREQALVIE